MKKNWLIRTKEHEIIGPVSQDKVLSLLEENKLLDEDELCQGNSFWFYVKEKNFLMEFLGLDNLEEDNNEQNDFVLESNSGDEKKLESQESVSSQKVEEDLPDVENPGKSSEETKISVDIDSVKVLENEEVLGDKFKLPDNKKSQEIESVKKTIQSEIERK